MPDVETSHISVNLVAQPTSLPMKRSIILLSILAFVLGGCFSAKVAGLGNSDVDRMQTKYPGLTLDQLKQGQSLFESNCATCHPLKEPKAYTEEAWAQLVPGMSKKVNDNAPNTLSESDQDLILKYVITMKTNP